jgi:SnoaL-like domain
VRRFIALMNDGDHERVLELCHPEVEVVLRDGRVLRGVEELQTYLRGVVDERPLYEVTLAEVRALDERRLIVDSRMRWMDEERVLRDDPVVWALELEEGLLRRSTPVRTVPEAEALLSAAGAET